MITITQVPQRTLGVSSIAGSGHTLTLDGVDYDLSLLADGDTAINEPENSPIIKAERVGENYIVSVLVAFDPNAADYDPNFANEVITL